MSLIIRHKSSRSVSATSYRQELLFYIYNDVTVMYCSNAIGAKSLIGTFSIEQIFAIKGEKIVSVKPQHIVGGAKI